MSPRPVTKTVEVTREPVDGTCPECGAEHLCTYPVLSEGGWFTVVKCQECLASVSREPDQTGPIVLLSATL